MPKYWVKNYFAHGRFPEVGQKQKPEKKKKRRERLNDGDNNGAWRTQAAWANKASKNRAKQFLPPNFFFFCFQDYYFFSSGVWSLRWPLLQAFEKKFRG